MNVLFEGIYDKYSGCSALVSALSGGLHLDEAPQGMDPPYAVFHLVSAVPDWTQDDTEFHEAIIQISLYSGDDAATEITNLYDLLTTCFDWCDLVVTGWTSIYVVRDLAVMTRRDETWQYSIQYRIGLQKI